MGEISLAVESLTLLAKALRPPPEKFHGLRDVEQRYRQRYLDLISNREVHETMRARSRIISAIRAFFDERGFLEVDTPVLVPIPAGAMAQPFVHAPPRARPRDIPPHRDGALPEAPHRRGAWTRSTR